ncbi:dihydropteroate synthase [Hypnocyclicus thermotrophus]|uniref:Dihydropteroate synthase n=1 Tax=Hypnocyclicus thermotrophus TaxID=1627895 RepID=A0AA46DYH9_9FUSO|nr:dihydropteroate synthase [Hypnocyclicus thermotrophus]TDT69752.1 dihydropteroate synthase [Hypnocyclicus thermotrophus]
MKKIDFFENTKIMGILNVTPDSFSDGGKYNNIDKALIRVEEMIKEGADIIDVGAESSRPGAKVVPLQEELDRVIPIVSRIKKEFDVILSIDTYKSEVAKECLKYNVDIINDITGFRDEKMLEVVKEYECYLIAMHMQGTPQTMQNNPTYNNIINDIKDEFKTLLLKLDKYSIEKNRLILDPGIGFGKTIEHNLEILKYLNKFKEFELPILIGASRKSFIGKILDVETDDRLEGSLAVAALSVQNGANILRVHDVKETKRVAKMIDAIMKV